MMLAYALNTVGYVDDSYVPMFTLDERIDHEPEHMGKFLDLVHQSPLHRYWLDFLEGVASKDEFKAGNAYLELVLDGSLEYVRV